MELVQSTSMTAKHIADLRLYDDVKAYVLKKETLPGVRRSNVVSTFHHGLIVYNARGLENVFDLDTYGFAFRVFPTSEGLDNVGSIERHLNEIPPFLKSVLHANEVRVFEYKVDIK